MKNIILAVMASFAMAAGAENPYTLPLWPDGNPNDNENPEEQLAEMTVYTPDDGGNGMAVAILPGGGYVMRAMGHEGHDVAKWYAENGITAAVVRYRMPNGHPDVPESDARQAVRMLRDKGYRLVGIMGSSAGGHLATTVSTHRADSLSRPDFTVLLYPVVTSDSRYTHHGSIKNLLGKKAGDWNKLREYSNELRVDADTPPAIIFYSDDDNTVSPENGALYYLALKNNNIKASYHVFPSGAHGWGFKESFPYLTSVKSLLLDWLSTLQKK